MPFLLTFDIQFNDLTLSVSDGIDGLTSVASRSCPVNALQHQASVGQNHTFHCVVVELFVLQKRPLSI